MSATSLILLLLGLAAASYVMTAPLRITQGNRR